MEAIAQGTPVQCAEGSDIMRNLLPGCLCLLLAASWVAEGAGQKPPEPSYQGKPLAYWIGTLRDKEPQARPRAMVALKAIGEAATPALLEALRDKDSWVRGGAVAGLFWIKSPSPAAVRALARALEDEDERA
jgi:hypothetical protein